MTLLATMPHRPSRSWGPVRALEDARMPALHQKLCTKNDPGNLTSHGEGQKP